MNAPGLKILLLADSRSFHTERYVDELRRQNCDVLTASLESGIMPHRELRRRGPFRSLHYALAAAEVRKLIDSFQPDVVNPHFASGYGFTAALAERRKSQPILLNLWGSDILLAARKSVFHRRKTGLALKAADFVIGDSDYLLDEAEKIQRIQNRRTIAWGIEREYLEFRRPRTTFGVPLRVLVPRPHEAVYNNMFIVRALADPANSGHIELTFPGFGGLVEDFRAGASRLINKGLNFYQKMTRRDYLKFAAEHDVYLSAARSDSSPVSLLEAMGLGLIPVAGDIPGVREWLDSDAGFLFDLTSESSLHEAITKLLAGGSDFDAMRRRNLERIEKKAIFEDNVAETITIMQELVAGRCS